MNECISIIVFCGLPQGEDTDIRRTVKSTVIEGSGTTIFNHRIHEITSLIPLLFYVKFTENRSPRVLDRDR